MKIDKTYTVNFKKCSVTARMYDINVTGYESTTNKLHLFDIETVDESIVENGIGFNKDDIEKNLMLFLYPDDSDDSGRMLRIYQQYLMVSAGAQFLLDECIAKGCKLYDLSDYAIIQINDTPDYGHSRADPLIGRARSGDGRCDRSGSQIVCLHQPHHSCRGFGKVAC